MLDRGAAVHAKNLVRRFGGVTAVDDLSIDIEHGEVFAVVGPDGAGKTTLIRLFCAALEPDDGELFVDGIDAVEFPGEVQGAVGYMPQRFSLYPDLSVGENLRFYAEIFGVGRVDFDSRSRQLLEDFSLLEFTDRRAEDLSGGMKQKLALACALIHSPAIIFLDEPTAGVDPVSRRAFWRILQNVNRSGTTVVVSTPYMDEAERATRVAFMVSGKILACGTPAELKKNLQGDVLEIVCEGRARARRALHDEPLVRSVEVFGDTLHALVPSAAQAVPAVKQRLADAGVAGVQIRKIAPSLEDTFVARLAP